MYINIDGSGRAQKDKTSFNVIVPISGALLSENSTPVLLAELIGDASAGELHEISKRRARPA